MIVGPRVYSTVKGIKEPNKHQKKRKGEKEKKGKKVTPFASASTPDSPLP